jgi:nucleoid DNA-binding protein
MLPILKQNQQILKKSEGVILIGFGSFSLDKRAA